MPNVEKVYSHAALELMHPAIWKHNSSIDQQQLEDNVKDTRVQQKEDQWMNVDLQSVTLKETVYICDCHTLIVSCGVYPASLLPTFDIWLIIQPTDNTVSYLPEISTPPSIKLAISAKKIKFFTSYIWQSCIYVVVQNIWKDMYLHHLPALLAPLSRVMIQTV